MTIQLQFAIFAIFAVLVALIIKKQLSLAKDNGCFFSALVQDNRSSVDDPHQAACSQHAVFLFLL